ncbi:hypothetical protein R2083_04385 [Nitrosomonas sp. Is35]|uniref:hypothetical protein n=1 Tax=Nitrosomonas sp. Is35 TaxID=3080534 RepID=UPI00294B1F05|nr:hypothetical protein [Nitrosomonas sp. Is35]MDV6346755.1 hypothetical protein [Nitrosomonas sp. Is35]
MAEKALCFALRKAAKTSGANHRKSIQSHLGVEWQAQPARLVQFIFYLACDNSFAHNAVELALDHVHDNEVARAYDRGERFEEFGKLFNWWGEQLSAAQHGATIIPLENKVTRC